MSAAQDRDNWKTIGSLDEFQPGTLTTVKCGKHQLVVARTEDGEISVLDNRCPHEGYPLAQGDLKGNALTCCWHNWKFDVRDGSCTLGGEAVRHYPCKVGGGKVECDLKDPDPEDFFPMWKASLAEGIRRYENGRAIRDGVRLLQGGYDPRDLLTFVARYDANHAEYGTTHTLALCSDLGRVFDRYQGVDAMHPISQAIDICGESNQRLPARKRPNPIEGATLEAIRSAVENEELGRAEGLLLGAFDDGTPLAQIDHWMFACISDHFLGFGHPLIYLTKLQEMANCLSREAAREIYSSLLHATIINTREDTLPYMHAYFSLLREVESEFETVWRSSQVGATFDVAGFRNSILDERGPEASTTLWNALKAGVSPQRIANVLVEAAAHRLLRFDVAIDADPELAENWVWGTHRLTFASAVRQSVERFEDPDVIRYLFQAVAFINSGRGMDEPASQRVSLGSTKSSAPEVLEAIQAGDSQLAIDRARSLLATPAEFEPLRIALEDLVLADGPVRPIVVAHLIKTLFCAIEEHARQADEVDATLPVLAMIRMLASPVRERRVRSVVQNSIAWVGEGKMQRKLTQ